MRYLQSLLVCIFVLLVPLAAVAQERIVNYDTHISVGIDGSMDVTENISVMVEGKNIRLGIFRDIPLYFHMHNRSISTPVTVSQVLRNGKPEHYWTERDGRYLRIFTGDYHDSPGARLRYGLHTYTIDWASTGHIRSFNKYDELYYNVTGNAWDFDMDSASATVTLPEGVNILQNRAYIGRSGSTEQFEGVVQEDGHTIVFTSPRPLLAHEGLTVAVGFDHGLVQNVVQESAYFMFLNQILEATHPYLTTYSLNVVFSMLVMLAYYLLVWILVGRDEPLGVIKAEFEPPKGVSPGQAAVVWQGKSIDMDKSLVASLVHLAAKGFITFTDSSFVKNSVSESPQAPEEQAIIDHAFGGASTVNTRKYSAKFGKAISEYEHVLGRLLKKYIKRNGKYIVPAFLLQAILVFILPGRLQYNIVTLAPFGLLLFYSPFFIVALNLMKKANKLMGIIVGSFIMLHGMVFLVFTASAVTGVEDILSSTNFVLIALLFCSMAMHRIFYHLLDRRSPEAVEIMRHLSGLAMFIKATDAHKYTVLDVPLFEKNLPYAIIFGLEKTWIGKIKALFPNYAPSWDKSTDSFIRTGSLSGVSRSVGSAGTAPSSKSSRSSGGGFSSSGSGGGGSSGGGSGGGGGGGR